MSCRFEIVHNIIRDNEYQRHSIGVLTKILKQPKFA